MLTGRPVKYLANIFDNVDIISSEDITKLKKYSTSDACPTIRNRCDIVLSMVKNKENLNRKQLSAANCQNKNYATNIAKKIETQGLDSIFTISRNPNSNVARLKLDARKEGFLISLACTPPPRSYATWTVELLTEEFNKQMSENGLTSNFSTTTVWRALDRNELKPHRSTYWCIPEVTPQFIIRMEYVLSLYALHYDADLPIVCLDEAALQIIKDVIPRLDASPGNVEKLDYEYSREGSKNIFVCLEPKTGKYFVRVTDTHTSIDWAHLIRHIVDHLYQSAEKVILVMDNLSTHNIESLYKAFPPEEARRIVERIIIVHTPVHASWLNMAEIAINVMKRESIGSRFRTDFEVAGLADHLDEWVSQKNSTPKPYSWNYTVEDAREKHPHLYKQDAVETSLAIYDSLNELCNVTNDIINCNQCVTSTNVEEDGDIIDLFRSVDSDGHEYWSVSIQEKHVTLNGGVEKKQITTITGQKNTIDGWLIPFPSKPRQPKNGKTARPVVYDFQFMAYGEDIVCIYNTPYDQNCPVVCIRKRSLNIQNLSQNTWVGNLHAEPKPKKKSKKYIQGEGDRRLGITIVYEPYTGKKSFCVNDSNDDLSWAQSIYNLVTNMYPDVGCIRLVVCKDDIDKIATLEQMFTADKALNIFLKIEIHVVPDNALWLNFAEIELINICRQCLVDRVSSAEQVTQHLVEWKRKRTIVDFNLSLDRFRKSFSRVYKPFNQTLSEGQVVESAIDST